MFPRRGRSLDCVIISFENRRSDELLEANCPFLTSDEATMDRILTVVIAIAALLASPNVLFAQDAVKPVAPLRVLLVAGGCCHDYETQTKLLREGIEKRIHAEVTVIHNPSKGTDTTFDIYESDDWADRYDVVLHDECSASVTDQPYVNRILNAHKNGVPAVNLHCAMHSYRWGNFRDPVEPDADNAGWYEMLGVQSTGHGPQAPIDIMFASTEHPVTRGLSDWKTINEELYNNIRVFGSAEVLASGKQLAPPNKNALKKDPNAQATESTAVVVWTNLYGPKQTKIFCTTLGHNNETVGDDRYLNLIVNGVLWATGNLTPEGKPKAAYAKQ